MQLCNIFFNVGTYCCYQADHEGSYASSSSTTGVKKAINSKRFPLLFVRSLWRGTEMAGGEWEWGKLEMCDDTVCTDGLTNVYPTRILTFGVDDFGRISLFTVVSVP